MVRILIILLLLSGCASKKKAVDIAKQQQEQGEQLDERNEANAVVSTTAESSGITAYDFSQLVGKWSLDYDGQMGDGFRFYFNETETGWEAGAEGKGKANANREETQTNSRIEVSWQERFDSLTAASEAKFREYESRIKSIEKTKEIDKKSTGLTVGGYILAAINAIAVILLCWFGWRLRTLSRSVKSFMNFKSLLKED